MPSKIRELLRSFSFRVGLLFFVALCTTLIALRVHVYYQSLSSAYEDIRAIINVHAEEISQGLSKHGYAHARALVRETIDNTHDKRLYVLLNDGRALTGNLDIWPIDVSSGQAWQEISLRQEDGRPPLDLLVRVATFKNKPYALMVGYDMQRIELLRDTLPRIAANNVLLSLLMSFILSVMVVWLVSRELARINRACESVMRGELRYRVSQRGSNDQFDKLGANINRMLDWIAALLNTVKDSTNAIAHDMRTPLSQHRLGLRTLMEDENITPEVQEKIREAVMRVDEIVEMFDNILSIARAESRSGTELFTRINVTEIVSTIIEFYGALLEEKSQRLSIRIPESPLWTVGDKQLITQAIVNLLDNAVKYTPQGGEIGVALRQEAGFIVLEVSDNGPGIPDPFLAKAKERFFRIDESRNTPGTGLGLSLADAVAGLHRGALTLENNRPGLRATLRLLQNI